MEKSLNDDRVYRTLTLPNGLSVLLISDPATDKAAASLDMHVGHYHDPADLPGLAHFLEHMLFLGTERYPNENGYSEFLAKNGGSSNAYTSTEDTNYHFNVAHAHLEAVLDRFSQFFVAPLFTPSATEREIKAVDSEHNKNKQVDMWRTFQLLKSISDPSHPFSKFGTGNKKTLFDLPAERGVDTRDALLAFHKRYSAHLMKLVVLGKEELDTLEAWVKEPTRFCLIANHSTEAEAETATVVSAGSPLAPVLRHIVRVVPVKDVRYVRLTWALPPLHALYKSKPTRLLSHLLGHESQGSILSLLKQKGWGMELMAGESQSDDGFSTFEGALNCPLQKLLFRTPVTALAPASAVSLSRTHARRLPSRYIARLRPLRTHDGQSRSKRRRKECRVRTTSPPWSTSISPCCAATWTTRRAHGTGMSARPSLSATSASGRRNARWVTSRRSRFGCRNSQSNTSCRDRTCSALTITP